LLRQSSAKKRWPGNPERSNEQKKNG